MEQRKLSNIRLTKKYHFRYSGLWVLVSAALVLLVNILLYLYFETRCGDLRSISESFDEQYASLRSTFLSGLVVEVTFFMVAIVFLAIMTSHRIAGVFIRLKNAFDDVKNGNLDHRLQFRSYDHLEDLEDSFNDMMGEINKKVGPPSPKKGGSGDGKP